MIRATTVLLNRFVFLAVVALILQAYRNNSCRVGGDVASRMGQVFNRVFGQLKNISDALR